MKTLRILLLLGLFVILFIGVVVVARMERRKREVPKQVTTIVTPAILPTVSPTATPTVTPSATSLPTPTPEPTAAPTVINLNVPFTIQAPYEVWDEFHGELCEEASILMAQWYATGKNGEAVGRYKNRIPQATADAELKAISDWEREHITQAVDTTAAETAKIGRDFLGIKNTTEINNPSAEQLKQALAEGNIILVPAAGRLLNNPHFKQPGPPYHMFIIRGYQDGNFITNDPGIRQGEGYVYSEKTIMNAIHDWTGSTSNIESGKKVVVVIGKN